MYRDRIEAKETYYITRPTTKETYYVLFFRSDMYRDRILTNHCCNGPSRKGGGGGEGRDVLGFTICFLARKRKIHYLWIHYLFSCEKKNSKKNTLFVFLHSLFANSLIIKIHYLFSCISPYVVLRMCMFHARERWGAVRCLIAYVVQPYVSL